MDNQIRQIIGIIKENGGTMNFGALFLAVKNKQT